VTTRSQFAGQALAALFNQPNTSGSFDDDFWDFNDHPELGNDGRRVSWDSCPASVRDQLKEYVVLKTVPWKGQPPRPDAPASAFHSANLSTTLRHYSALLGDLPWLVERTQRLQYIGQSELDLWLTAPTNRLTYHRVAALIDFCRTTPLMTPELDVPRVATPWPNLSAHKVWLKVGSARAPGNSTDVIGMPELGPWLTAATTLLNSSRNLLTFVHDESAGLAPTSVDLINDNGLATPWAPQKPSQVGAVLASACMFTVVAFTGMRRSEVELIPREDVLEEVRIGEVSRWLALSHVGKQETRARPDKWLIPPIARDAILVMQELLHILRIDSSQVHPATELPPLFARAAYSRGASGRRPCIRLERAIGKLGEAIDELSTTGLNAPRISVATSDGDMARMNGRRLRRTFAVLVASRPNGPEAAMAQFKWQSPLTAAGYFKTNPDAVSSAQRILYGEVDEVYRELVVNALLDEYSIWRQKVQQGETPVLPAGPDGRRKRDAFQSIYDDALTATKPNIEEDERRVRAMFREMSGNMTMTKYGFCDFTAGPPACGGTTGPVVEKCQPNMCMNHSTTTKTLAAHIVSRDGYRRTSRDRRNPSLQREQAAEKVRVIERDLGELLP
jgi:hypothetical protein